MKRKFSKIVCIYTDDKNYVPAKFNCPDLTIDDVENKTSQEVYLRYTSSLTGSQSPVTKYAFSKRICKVFGLKTTQKKIDGKVYRVFVR